MHEFQCVEEINPLPDVHSTSVVCHCHVSRLFPAAITCRPGQKWVESNRCDTASVNTNLGLTYCFLHKLKQSHDWHSHRQISTDQNWVGRKVNTGPFTFTAAVCDDWFFSRHTHEIVHSSWNARLMPTQQTVSLFVIVHPLQTRSQDGDAWRHYQQCFFWQWAHLGALCAQYRHTRKSTLAPHGIPLKAARWYHVVVNNNLLCWLQACNKCAP